MKTSIFFEDNNGHPVVQETGCPLSKSLFLHYENHPKVGNKTTTYKAGDNVVVLNITKTQFSGILDERYFMSRKYMDKNGLKCEEINDVISSISTDKGWLYLSSSDKCINYDVSNMANVLISTGVLYMRVIGSREEIDKYIKECNIAYDVEMWWRVFKRNINNSTYEQKLALYNKLKQIENEKE